MIALARRRLQPSDRHVRRARMTLAADSPRHQCAALAEEALRLCSLPGEDQGRVYYFRRLRVSGLAEDGDRSAWLHAFQSALAEQASQAIHGSDPRAAAADAVYFRSRQEACEALLRSIASRQPPLAWFWRHVSGLSRTSTAPLELAAVIEKLLETPASWSAVAAAIFSIAPKRDVIALFNLLPVEMIVHWLRELGADESHSYAAPLRFSESTSAMLARAVDAFEPESPAVLWLATLAVIAIQPSTAENRSAVRIAKASLRRLLSPQIQQAVPRQIRSSSRSIDASASAPPQAHGALDPASEPQPLAAPSDRNPSIFGEPTLGAGLFFLLNALRHLEIQNQNFGLLFFANLFRSLAADCGIDPADPILHCCRALEDQARAQADTEAIDARVLRLWRLKLRRWCWRHGRLSLGEIVRRSGFVSLTRTDLDITLALDSADVRIRRLGLDLNPGWLPWFGRVVRFHYRYRGELHG